MVALRSSRKCEREPPTSGHMCVTKSQACWRRQRSSTLYPDICYRTPPASHESALCCGAWRISRRCSCRWRPPRPGRGRRLAGRRRMRRISESGADMSPIVGNGPTTDSSSCRSGISCRRNGHFNFFNSPCSVGEGLPNILLLQVRVGTEDFGIGVPRGNQPHHVACV